MKKLFLVLFAICTLASCSVSDGDNNAITIYDEAGILTSEAIDSIKAADCRSFQVAIITVDTLPFQHLNERCKTIFDSIATIQNDGFAFNGILIIGSANPNYAVAKYGSSFEESSDGLGHYGSMNYYGIQVDEELTPQQKIIHTLNHAVNNAITNGFIFSSIKEELFGFLYNISIPDDSFIYQYIIKPCQWPFLILFKVLGSFYLTIFIAALLLFILAEIISVFAIRFVYRTVFKDDKNINFVQQQLAVVGGAILTIVFYVPMILGGLSFSAYFGLDGIEFIEPLVNYADIPLDLIQGNIPNSLTESSLLISLLALLAFYFSDYKASKGFISAAKCGVFALVFFICPIAVSWFAFCFFLFLAITNFKIFWDDNYKYCRVHGIGVLESILLSLLTPLFVLFGTWFGFKAGMNNTEFHVNTELPSNNTIVQTSAKQAITEWLHLTGNEIQQENCD